MSTQRRPERLGRKKPGVSAEGFSTADSRLQDLRCPAASMGFLLKTSSFLGTSHSLLLLWRSQISPSFLPCLSLLSAIGCDVPHGAVMKQDETHTTGSAASEGRGALGKAHTAFCDVGGKVLLQEGSLSLRGLQFHLLLTKHSLHL